MPGQVERGSCGYKRAPPFNPEISIIIQEIQHYPRAQHQVCIVVNMQAVLQSVGIQPLTEEIVSVGAGQVPICHRDISALLGGGGRELAEVGSKVRQSQHGAAAGQFDAGAGEFHRPAEFDRIERNPLHMQVGRGFDAYAAELDVRFSLIHQGHLFGERDTRGLLRQLCPGQGFGKDNGGRPLEEESLRQGFSQGALAGSVEVRDQELTGYQVIDGRAIQGDILGVVAQRSEDFSLILGAPVVIAEFYVLAFDKVGDDEAFQRGEIIAGDGDICPHGKGKLAQAGNASHIDGGLSLHHEFGEARTSHGEPGTGHNGEPTRGEGTAVQGQGTGIEHGSLYYHALQSGGA